MTLARLGAAALVLLATGCAGAQRAGRPAVTPSLRVSGEGRTTAAPDVTVFALGVETTGKDVAGAVAEADRRMRAVSAALTGAGIASRDLRTTRYDVVPERRFDPQRGGPGELVGYRVVHELRVVVRGGDPARAGVALDAAMQGGANLVHSISFEKEDLSPERARALAAAVTAARGKAEALAAAAGRALGEVVAVSEASGRAPVVPFRKAMVATEAAGAPLEAGELEVVAEVEVEFALR
jgi:uncharacterized protein YggE